MRKLITADMFSFARVIRASGMRQELKPLLQRAAEKGASAEDIGFDGILVVLEALAEKKTESAIYEALSGPFETTAEAVKEMPLDEMLKGIKEILAMNEMTSFFRFASGTLGKN